MDQAFLEGLIGDEEVVQAVLAEHQRTVADVEYRHLLKASVEAAGGRNLTAIRALLDEEALKGAEDVPAAISAALKGLKREAGYLFEGAVRQPYSSGRAEAVRERYSMEDISAMSMAEYRRFRMGQ